MYNVRNMQMTYLILSGKGQINFYINMTFAIEDLNMNVYFLLHVMSLGVVFELFEGDTCLFRIVCAKRSTLDNYLRSWRPC